MTTMSHRAWVATRKGLFELRRARGGWEIASVAFLGEPVSAVLPPDPAEPGRPMIAALNLGHFGVKCHASGDAGRTWREVGAPLYPPQPAGAQDDVEWKLVQMGAMASGTAGRPGAEGGARLLPPRPAGAQDDVEWKLVQIWALAGNGGTVGAGTRPGGLFRSDDGGASWQINEPLWTDPRRREWSGGGYDAPGIHSIVLDPRSPDPARQRILVGVSTGGAWASDDGGASWVSRARGMRADYMP